MKGIRFAWFYLSTIISRYTAQFLVVTLIILAAFLAFFTLRPHFSHPSITEGVVGTYTENDLPLIVTHLLSDSLMVIDKANQPQPHLITGFDVNPEATVYTLKLKNNLYWSDGTLVKASDISLPISGAEVSSPNEQTIQIKLADSFSPLPSILNKPIFKKDTQIGMGPYQIVSREFNSIFLKKVVLKSIDDRLPTVTVRFYPSEKIARTALDLGEIKSLFGVVESDNLNVGDSYRIFSKPNITRLVTIFYNTKDPVLSDDNFRLALSYAAPAIKGELEAKTSLPTNSWAFNPAVKDYLDNFDMAKIALNKVKNGKDSQITLTTTPSLKLIGEKIVSSWNKLGVKAVLRVESGIPQNFQALLITQNIPTDPDQYSLWHSTQVQTNISKFSSPRVDKDLEDGRKITDLEQRKAKYQDFQKTLLDHAPATFLFFPKYNVLYIKKVEPQLQQLFKMQLPELN